MSRVLWCLLLVIACGDDATPDSGIDASRDAGGEDAGEDAPARDVPVDVAVTETVEVGHVRELRGTWVATVSRINWPSSDDPAGQRADLEAILDTAVATGLNTVFFQVRPEADALYASELEPWSRYLTGTQGVDPGYDPLAFAIEQAHERGLELHAWLNPYRARAGAVGATSAGHVSQTMPDAVVTYGSFLWMDPGNPDAFDHTLAVVRDIVQRYDVDGIHMDDYFYPYPESGAVFDDDDTFAAYGAGMSRPDWRRDNVNRMVRSVGEAVAEENADVRWGISPFGIYRPGMPEGVVGLDQYATLYADVLAWMNGGWLDYVAPQLYWPTTSSGQPYRDLLAWWSARAEESGRTLWIGNSASRAYGVDEYRAELDAIRADGHADGAVWWSVAPILANEDGLADVLAAEYYARPAASPPLVDAVDVPAVPAVVVADDGAIEITPARASALLGRVPGRSRRVDLGAPAAKRTTALDFACRSLRHLRNCAKRIGEPRRRCGDLWNGTRTRSGSGSARSIVYAQFRRRVREPRLFTELPVLRWNLANPWCLRHLHLRRTHRRNRVRGVTGTGC